MRMQPTLCVILAAAICLATSGIVCAEVIPVTNFSFEDPGQGKIKGWDGEGVGGTPAVDVPGWSSDTTPGDSGVETGWGATDGDYTGFLQGSDPSIFNLTDHVIAAGEVFELLVDAKNGNQLIMDLYYDDGGTRVQAATMSVGTVTGNAAAPLAEYSLSFSANDLPASIGKQIGIELDNGSSWMQFDNVRLNVVPEPGTFVLTGLGLLGVLIWRRKR